MSIHWTKTRRYTRITWLVVVVCHVTVVAIGQGLLKEFWPMVIGSLLPSTHFREFYYLKLCRPAFFVRTTQFSFFINFLAWINTTIIGDEKRKKNVWPKGELCHFCIWKACSKVCKLIIWIKVRWGWCKYSLHSLSWCPVHFRSWKYYYMVTQNLLRSHEWKISFLSGEKNPIFGSSRSSQMP